MTAAPINTRRWKRTRALVLARDKHECQLQWPGCTGRATHVDHITPRRFGGSNDVANLRAACGVCNLKRGDGSRPIEAVVSPW